MAHFYGTVLGNRGVVSRCGSKSSGISAQVAGWTGSVRVDLYHKDGQDCVRISKLPWRGRGSSQIIYEGPLAVE
jgi:hypothetical protein